MVFVSDFIERFRMSFKKSKMNWILGWSSIIKKGLIHENIAMLKNQIKLFW